MKRTEKQALSGYMTLEAAFIIPWVLFMLVLFIYLGFYMYDKDVLFQDTYAITFRGSIQPISNQEKRAYIQANAPNQYGKKYFSNSDIQINTKVSDKQIDVQSSLTVRQSLGVQEPTLLFTQIPIKIDIEIANKNPTEMLRDFRRMERMAEKIMLP